MRIGYLECFSGISGDMLLGALVDAGVPFALLEETTAALNVKRTSTNTNTNRIRMSSIRTMGIRMMRMNIANIRMNRMRRKSMVMQNIRIRTSIIARCPRFLG